jgi:hypothetical protein
VRRNEDAERDCTRALTLNKNNVKALFRRAQARTELQKLSEAHQGIRSPEPALISSGLTEYFHADLQDALYADPNNEVVNKELARVAVLLQKGKDRAQPVRR